MTPFFSIIIPVYNVAPYLRTCLDSILAAEKALRDSTDPYLRGLEIEIICIDDGSTDEGGEILDEYAEKKFRDRLQLSFKIVHQKNQGLGPARNTGLDLANGEYVLFIDSDDAVFTEFLCYLADQLKVHSVDVLKFGFQEVENQTQVCVYERKDFREFHVEEDDAASLYNAFATCYAWQACFRRQIIGDLRFECITPGEDVLFTTQVFVRMKSGVVTQTALYLYLQRAGSLMHKKKILPRQIQSCAYSTRRRVEILKRWMNFGEVKNLIRKMIRTTFVGQLGILLNQVAAEDDEIAWGYYVDEGRRLINLSVLSRYESFIYWTWLVTKNKIVWRILLFLPWSARVWLLKSSVVRKLKLIIRG